MSGKMIKIAVLFFFVLTAQSQVLALAAPIQRIDVVNMLWNPGGTGGAAGMTPTSVIVAFNNGGSRACFTSTLLFQAGVTVLAGTGQPCVAAITSVTVTPVAGPAGLVYAAPSAVSINGSYYTNQLIISNQTAPVFDTTNGAVATPGAVQVVIQGQYAETKA